MIKLGILHALNHKYYCISCYCNVIVIITCTKKQQWHFQSAYNEDSFLRNTDTQCKHFKWIFTIITIKISAFELLTFFCNLILSALGLLVHPSFHPGKNNNNRSWAHGCCFFIPPTTTHLRKNYGESQTGKIGLLW